MEILIAAGVSAVVELIKKYAGTSGWRTGLMLIVVSFAGAAILFWLEQASLMETVTKVALMAAGIYGLLIASWKQQG